jgi:hypothetical protein
MELTSVAVVSNTTPEVVSDGANIQHQQHSASTAQDTDVQSEVDLEEGRSGSSVSTAGPRALEWSIEKMEVNAKGGKKKLLLQDIGIGALAWNLDSLMDVYICEEAGGMLRRIVLCVLYMTAGRTESGDFTAIMGPSGEAPFSSTHLCTSQSPVLARDMSLTNFQYYYVYRLGWCCFMGLIDMLKLARDVNTNKSLVHSCPLP